jgi:hypothetical protein
MNMSNYKPIDSETLLAVRDNPMPNVHYSFYDTHIMNLMDDNKPYEGETMAELAKNAIASIKERIDKLNAELDNLHIYKFININTLKYWLQVRKLFWDRISDSWEDPYENYFLKENFVLQDGTPVDASKNIPGVFGQSWTMREETDAMWRIYSKENINNPRTFYGVRIETTARKLLNLVYVGSVSMANTWIGKVRYLSEIEINQTLNGGVGQFNDTLADSFFNKRNEFDHEWEFRAVTLLDTNTINNTIRYKRIAFDIADMDDFIDSYVLDPRLSDDKYKLLFDQLIAWGVDSSKIRKSSLYHFNPIEVTLL